MPSLTKHVHDGGVVSSVQAFTWKQPKVKPDRECAPGICNELTEELHTGLLADFCSHLVSGHRTQTAASAGVEDGTIKSRQQSTMTDPGKAIPLQSVF